MGDAHMMGDAHIMYLQFFLSLLVLKHFSVTLKENLIHKLNMKLGREVASSYQDHDNKQLFM